MPILPGVMPIVGETDEQAKDQLDTLQGWLSSTKALTLLSQRLHSTFPAIRSTARCPTFRRPPRGQAFNKTLLDMARRENMTLRDLYNVAGAARGHWAIYGSRKRIADIFEEWFYGGLADGFIIMPPYFPGALDDLSTWSCRNSNGAASIARIIQGRHCATISARALRQRRQRRAGALPLLLNRTNVNRQEPKP